MDRPRWTWWLPAIFAAVVLSFVAATAIGQWQMFAADRPALAIANSAAPGIEHLTAARGQIRSLQLAMYDELERLDRGEPSDLAVVEQARRAMEERFDEYLVLPVFTGEQTHWGDVLRTEDALDHTVMRFKSEVERGDVRAARATLGYDFAIVANQLSDEIMAIIELNASYAQDLALEIRRLRSRAMYAAFGLDVIATLIAVLGAIMLRRMLRNYSELAEQHHKLDEAKASELEQFASRVAHDILSPLGAVGFALQLAAEPQDDARRARIVERGTSSLNRVKRLVHGLLDFARAGATPDPGARADVRATMRDLALELEPVAEAAGVELTIDDDGQCFANCNAGVLTSLVANLARNAIKYIGGGGPERRIEICARHDDAVVRVEVKDTGPGLAPDMEARVFEPYARARGTTEPGIGLGLATVKRLAEAHGGRVGVRSVPGRGCTFWFELPLVACDEPGTLQRPAFASA